jgi:predicted DNA-binding protein with PD1-like motif
MQYFRGATAVEVIAIRVDAGEDLLESVTRVISETGVAAGAFVSGCGNLEHVALEVSANMNWPPAAYAQEKQGPADIISVSGHVANGYPELYLTVSKRNEVLAGKVMKGTRVLHFAELTLLRAGNTRWARVGHPQSGVPLLQAQAAAGGAAPAAQVTLMGRPVDPGAVALVSKELMRRHGVLPVARSGDTLVVALTDPNNPVAIDDLRQATGLRIQAVAVAARDLMPALQQVLAG